MSGSTSNVDEPADQIERTRALDTTQSFLVEAPAGSGKTALLIQRFLKLLAGADITDPAQVMAITFTRKATGELRERVLHQLLTAQTGIPTTNPFDTTTRDLTLAVLARDTELHWNLLAEPARLNIRTIDGVTSAITRALPVFAGPTAALTPADAPRPLYTEAARRTLMRLGQADSELSRALEYLLLHRDGNLADVQRHLAGMLSTREQWGQLLTSDGSATTEITDAWLEAEVLPRLERALDRAICRTLTQAARALPAGFLTTLSELAAGMAHAEGYRDAPSPLAFCAGKPQPPEELAAHVEHWRALATLVITHSQQNWRGGFNRNQIGFVTTREQRDELKQVVEFLRAHDEGSDHLCSTLCAIHELPSPTYPAAQWQLTKALFRVLGQCIQDLGEVFIERGTCDFIEPALVARTALASSEVAANNLEGSTGTRLRHLLVDEMQDTSSGQYELIELLTRGWTPQTGQTVFLVGDPKQSIYLFRQARVERFVRTLTTGRLGSNALTLETLRLTANFRSRPQLVQAFNDDFSRVFPAEINPARPEDVPFYPATASRPADDPTPSVPHSSTASPSMSGTPSTPNPSVPHSSTASPSMSGTLPSTFRNWHLTQLPYTPDAPTRQSFRRTQRDLEAATIVDIIRAWQSRPLPADRAAASKPWRIAVLVRSRNQVGTIVEQLRTAGIATRAVDIDPLAERQEVLDLIALTRALTHPADRTAWLAVLRAPWCGLTLADLHQLAGADDLEWSERTLLDAITERTQLLSPDGRERLTPVAAVLQAAITNTETESLSSVVAATWRALNAAAAASAEELANAERFFALLDQVAPGIGSGFDLETLEARVQDLYAAPALTAGAVEIVTIHGAKGLEWDVVLVPALDQNSPSSTGRLLDWIELDPEGDPLSAALPEGVPLSLFAPIAAKGEDSEALNKWMRGLANAREAAERKRLLYVVCTRAREELHLFASPFTKAKGGVLIEKASLLHAAWPAVETAFARITAPPAAIPMPASQSLEVETLALAAAAESRPPTQVERIPQRAFLPAPTPEPADPAPHRPEGSFATRVIGNTLHALLDQVAAHLATGATSRTLQSELRTWPPRVRNLLLAAGLGPADLAPAQTAVLRGLENTLADPEGLWVFSPYEQAASELSLVTAAEGQTIRIDRTFLAGPEPNTPGASHRWIIDIKTGTQGKTGLASWLASQRTLYTPQLERYARALAEPGQPINLALYFPQLPKLLWYPLETRNPKLETLP